MTLKSDPDTLARSIEATEQLLLRFVADALVMRVGFHNGAHAGQILDLRRVLGLPRVIG